MITTSKKGVRTARISRALCGACPLPDQCCPGRPSRQIALGEHEELQIAARQALNDPVTAAHLRHTRPRIERLLGLLACRYGARKSRYIGTQKAMLQASWAAALVNLNPIGDSSPPRLVSSGRTGGRGPRAPARQPKRAPEPVSYPVRDQP
jgi:hypothetical protein